MNVTIETSWQRQYESGQIMAQHISLGRAVTRMLDCELGFGGRLDTTSLDVNSLSVKTVTNVLGTIDITTYTFGDKHDRDVFLQATVTFYEIAKQAPPVKTIRNCLPKNDLGEVSMFLVTNVAPIYIDQKRSKVAYAILVSRTEKDVKQLLALPTEDLRALTELYIDGMSSEDCMRLVA